MAKSEIVVALDIGTTKVCTLVAEIGGEDEIQILGSGVAPCAGVRNGVVVDIPDTAAAIRASIREAEKSAGVHIATVFVGITGAHIESQNNRAAVQVDGEITEEDLRQARQAARQVSLPPEREVLHNIPRQYILDGQAGVRHPVGMSASRLEVETHVVTAATTFMENIAKCVQREHLEIEEFVVEPLAAGLAVLTDAERQLGVALADIGGGTTDVALFVDGAITHTTVLPVGGAHVTSDLAIGFRVDPEQAERLKTRSGTSIRDDVEPTEYVEVQMLGESEPREVPRRLVPEIIAPRMEELFLMLRRHIEKAAGEGVFISQCVLSGGGALLGGAAEIAQQVLEMPVRIGRPREVNDPRGVIAGPAYATAVGLLVFAAGRISSRRPEKEPRPIALETLDLVAAWLRRILRRF